MQNYGPHLHSEILEICHLTQQEGFIIRVAKPFQEINRERIRKMHIFDSEDGEVSPEPREKQR